MGVLRNNTDIPMLVSPALTPFRSNGSVDYEALSVEIEYMLATVKPSILAVAAVEAQEYQYLTDIERTALIHATADLVRGRVPIMVGVSHPSLNRVKELCEIARCVKASAVQVLVPNRPTGGRVSTSEITEYFTEVSRGTPLPIMAYHNPGPGANLSPEQIAGLFAIDGVEACKESSRNMRHIGQTKSLLPSDGLYLGTMEVLLSSLEIGCDGATVPVPASAIARQLMDAYVNEDYSRAQWLQQKFMVFPGKWVQHGLVSVMKTALNAIGVPMGDSYPPFGKMDDAAKVELTRFVQMELKGLLVGRPESILRGVD